MKTCTKCNVEKPLSEYAKRSESDTLRPTCKECRNKQVQGWRDSNPARKMLCSYKGRAKRKGYEFELTEEDFRQLDTLTCEYCGGDEKMGYDRIDSNLGYTLDNVTPCCYVCNTMKSNLTREEFIAHVLKIGEHTNVDSYSTHNGQTL